MSVVLVGTESGCVVVRRGREAWVELAGRKVCALAAERDGACVAVVDDREIWRRSAGGAWSKVTTVEIGLQSIVSSEGTLYCGGMEEASVFRVSEYGVPERLTGFAEVGGRGEWFAGGPPLGVRGLTATADGRALLAAVHVGGIPRSEDGGATWTPTIPVMFDVHEVRAHRSLPGLVVAATAVGLCVSRDGGRGWEVHAEGLEVKNSLAVAVLEEEVLFSVQDGPFAERAQIWRWRLVGGRIESVRDGLPEWMEGKIDTNHIAAGGGRAAIVDGGGTVWLSQAGSCGWEPVAEGLSYAYGLLIVDPTQEKTDPSASA